MIRNFVVLATSRCRCPRNIPAASHRFALSASCEHSRRSPSYQVSDNLRHSAVTSDHELNTN